MPYAHLRILLHAPTAEALERARSNARNLLHNTSQRPAAVRILTNSSAVPAVLQSPDAEVDAITSLCPNTLAKYGLQAPAHVHVLPAAAMLELARLQAEGWAYIRA